MTGIFSGGTEVRQVYSAGDMLQSVYAGSDLVWPGDRAYVIDCATGIDTGSDAQHGFGRGFGGGRPVYGFEVSPEPDTYFEEMAAFCSANNDGRGDLYISVLDNVGSPYYANGSLSSVVVTIPGHVPWTFTASGGDYSYFLDNTGNTTDTAVRQWLMIDGVVGDRVTEWVIAMRANPRIHVQINV